MSDDDEAVGYEQAALERLAQEVVARRAELGMSQEQVAEVGGPSVATLRLIEGARQPSYRPLTLGALDRALLWPPGHALRVLRGQPADATPPAQESVRDFDEFYRAFQGRVRAQAAYRFGENAADDIAQEVMLRAYDNLDRLVTMGDPWPWLTVVARNVGINHMRQQVRVLLDDEAVQAVLADDSGIEQVHVRDEVRRLSAAIRRLDDRDRSILLAREPGTSIADIALQLGVSKSAVRQRLLRARRALARIYTERDVTG